MRNIFPGLMSRPTNSSTVMRNPQTPKSAGPRPFSKTSTLTGRSTWFANNVFLDRILRPMSQCHIQSLTSASPHACPLMTASISQLGGFSNRREGPLHDPTSVLAFHDHTP
jgi:hypothetical protein